MEQNTSNLFELHVDQQSNAYLHETARWAKFLAIVGFIACAFIVLAGIFAGSIMSSMGDGFGMAGLGVGAAIMYILIALLWFFPCLFLYRFAVRTQVALRNNEQQNLTAGLANLKSYFKFVGILTIIFISIYLLIFIFAMLGAGMASFG
ncbi:MAG TPA: DUF5362 family protein [Chitinophagaceae bacterium]|nr:DUF5362 family protein [Chitinophagaceae bacterium]